MLDFIKKLFKTKNDENISEEKPEINLTNEKSQLEHLWTKFKEEKFSEVINEAIIIVEREDNTLKNEALKLIGLSYFRQGKFNLSEQTFVSLTENSENPDDWFNLVTSSTLNKNVQLSEKAYAKTIELYQKSGTKENLPIPQIYYYYMQGLRDIKEYAKAFEQLNKLKEIYSKLVISDSTFLYLRGVPFLEHTIEASKEILENIEKTKASNFIRELTDKLDDEGKQYINEFEKTINYSC